jgi:hypothetical protein
VAIVECVASQYALDDTSMHLKRKAEGKQANPVLVGDSFPQLFLGGD